MIYRIDGFQEGIAQNVKSQIATGLDAAIGISVARIGKCQILLLDGKLLPADIEAHNRQVVHRRVGGEQIALLLLVVLAAWDGIVDGLAKAVVDEGQSGAGIGYSSVSRSFNLLAANRCGSAVELPEALRAINWGVVWRLACQRRLVNIAESVEGCAMIGIILVLV